MKRLTSFILLLICITCNAIDVTTFRFSTPIVINAPLLIDTTDVNGKKIEVEELLFNSPQRLTLWKEGAIVTSGEMKVTEKTTLLQAGFTLQNTRFAKIDIKADCKSRHTVYLDEQEVHGETNIVPGTHEVTIKILQKTNESDTLKITVNSEQENHIFLDQEGPHYWTLQDLMNGTRLGTARLSSSGKYILQDKSTKIKDGTSQTTQEIIEVATGNRIVPQNFVQWTNSGDKYICTAKRTDGATNYYSVDVKTGNQTIVGTYKGKGYASLVANETKFLITENVEGPRETNKDVHQILEPDDRQPGWRNRSNIYLQDIKTGIVRQITAGQKNTYANISDDGKKLLITIREDDMRKRPFNFTTILCYDTETNAVDTLVKKDGFVHGGSFSPDGKTVALLGSPEAFDGIGNTLDKNKTPNSYEYEIFTIDIATHVVKCITRNFDPSIKEFKWNKADNNIYALTEDKDLQAIYRINPSNGNTTKVITSEPFIFRFDIATEKPVLAYVGQSTQHSDKSWLIDLKSGKEKLLEDINPERLANIKLGECKEWNFKTERGDTIYGCYYLPPYFDETKTYPMLVYYYGGCSPVGRYLDSYYCYQEWAAMGYVVYVLQPSGCSGFGQEFASRHVNAYGDYTADDIIQGTKQFCKEHTFVNDKKIGCLGASYGGFMTQYLQTKTDIFAAAMSHAGISNPASYWGFGYWGYSYNTTAAANSYPWNNVELYSGHAPLFNADKVHTPILFMHGGADTNVPINESIQMFTALKILGRETAFITVDGENHHILDFNKRIRWHDSIMAWFARWLQDDSTWWDTMYPAKNL